MEDLNASTSAAKEFSLSPPARLATSGEASTSPRLESPSAIGARIAKTVDRIHASSAAAKGGGAGGKAAMTKDEREDRVYKQMVAKMQEIAGERGGYLHGRGALDHDDLLYLKEQMAAEDDEERLRKRMEKRAFQAFRAAASQADTVAPAAAIPRIELKPKSGIRQQSLIRSVIAVKPRDQQGTQKGGQLQRSISLGSSEGKRATQVKVMAIPKTKEDTNAAQNGAHVRKVQEAVVLGKGPLGLAYESSSDDES